MSPDGKKQQQYDDTHKAGFQIIGLRRKHNPQAEDADKERNHHGGIAGDDPEEVVDKEAQFTGLLRIDDAGVAEHSQSNDKNAFYLCADLLAQSGAPPGHPFHLLSHILPVGFYYNRLSGLEQIGRI